MSSLINSAMSGLTAAQASLSTTSNNISNYTVAGYSRQTTVLSQASSTLVGNAYYGNGVNVNGVQREYNQFITEQLRTASAQHSAVSYQHSQISNIDQLLASSTTSLSTSMQKFFTNVQNVVSNADDPSARQAMLGNAEGLVNQFQTTARYLANMQNSANTDIKASVEQINTYSNQIANLNKQIGKLSGNGAVPNNLFDQRDQLVNELNDLIGVSVSQQDGNYVVSMANGTTLVSASNPTRLVAMPSNSDSARLTVGYVDENAGNVEIPEKLLTSGALGGLLTFRSQDLDTAQNQLGQLAVAFTQSFNAQHAEGYDSKGQPGTDFFSMGNPAVISNAKNSTDTSITAAFSEGSTNALRASNYNVSWTGSEWSVTRLADNAPVTAQVGANGSGEQTLTFDGVTLTVSGTPAAKDSFLVKPVQDVINGMSVAITSESQIAAAGAPGGASDNRNVQKLLNLQDEKLVNGNATLTQAYASLVSTVGNKTKTPETTQNTQQNVVNQLSDRQQSVSGVNLDEEYANLQKYQQFYMANAQVLRTAESLFSALMGIRS